jgi:hypothetical protein
MDHSLTGSMRTEKLKLDVVQHLAFSNGYKWTNSGGQDSDADHRYLHFYPVYTTCCNGNLGNSAYDGLYGLWRGRRGIDNGMMLPMTSSVLRTAFERVAPHISNLDEMKMLVDEVEKKTRSLESVLSELESRLEGAEVTLRTDIRILINECRHLGERTTPR